MKKILLLFVAATLAACSAEPVETEGIDSLNAAVAGKQMKAQSTKTAFDIPTLTLGEGTTESELEVVVTPGETGAMGGFRLRWMTAEDYATSGWGDNEDLAIDMCQEMFQVTGNDDTFRLSAEDNYTFVLSDFITGEGESCERALSCGMGYVFKVEALNSSGKDGLQKSGWSEIYSFSTLACPEVECETGYLYGNTPLKELDNSANWGWAHHFDKNIDGIEKSFELLGGAAQNDVENKGELLGSISVKWNENGIVDINAPDNIELKQIYVSDEKPTDAAPGRFGTIGNEGDKNQDGQFWFIIRASACK